MINQKIQQTLIANALIDICKKSDKIIFRESWCSQERIIRFTSDFFRNLFGFSESQKGRWHSGDFVMYELHNTVDGFLINCILDITNLPSSFKAIAFVISDKNQLSEKDKIIYSHTIKCDNNNINELILNFEKFLDTDLQTFEYSLYNELSQKLPSIFNEGKYKNVLSGRYERSTEARNLCISTHGTVCKICGFDFKKTYGAEFEGIIEVHHIVPLECIGSQYSVNPVTDLLPVCSNCHTALHSKKDGVYLPDELKKMLKNKPLNLI